MEQALLSDTFKRYIEIITAPELMDSKQMVKVIGDALSIVADALFIGRADGMKKTARSLVNHESNIEKAVFFSSEQGYDDRPVVKKFEVGDRSKVILNIYPVKGHEWTKDELSDIDIIFNCTFVFLSRSRLLKAMNHISNTDSQTNIPNYMAVMGWCGEREAKNELKEYSAIFINIKNFKYINKVGTSKCGDLCLFNFAHLLVDMVGKDGIAGRLGGDNFIVFLKNEKVADFLNKMAVVKINCELPQRTHTFSIESRMGVYNIKPNDTTSEAMNCSSIAQKIARANYSKNIVWFEEGMLKDLLYAKEVSADFHRAIADKEFVAFYQPKINIKDKSLCGCEALARWIKNGAIVPPAEFIPVLEEEGTICQLDFYMLDRVCKDIKEWIEMGIEPVRISVNFSTLHLYDKELVGKIVEIISKNEVDPEYLEIEITEISGYDDYDNLANFVNSMKAEGIYTSIDDFGTGYSSMHLLRAVNVEQIKLDKSFLDTGNDDNSKHRIMLRYVVNMINELGMSALAEGIETKEQEDLLCEISCDIAQGYLYDKPLSKDVFAGRLTDRDYYKE